MEGTKKQLGMTQQKGGTEQKLVDHKSERPSRGFAIRRGEVSFKVGFSETSAQNTRLRLLSLEYVTGYAKHQLREKRRRGFKNWAERFTLTIKVRKGKQVKGRSKKKERTEQGS